MLGVSLVTRREAQQLVVESLVVPCFVFVKWFSFVVFFHVCVPE